MKVYAVYYGAIDSSSINKIFENAGDAIRYSQNKKNKNFNKLDHTQIVNIDEVYHMVPEIKELEIIEQIKN